MTAQEREAYCFYLLKILIIEHFKSLFYVTTGITTVAIAYLLFAKLLLYARDKNITIYNIALCVGRFP